MKNNYNNLKRKTQCPIKVPSASDLQKKLAQLHITMKEVPETENIIRPKIDALRFQLININTEIANANSLIADFWLDFANKFLSGLSEEDVCIFNEDFSDFNVYDYLYYEKVPYVSHNNGN